MAQADLSRHSAEHDGGSSGLLKAGRPSRPVRRPVHRRPGRGGSARRRRNANTRTLPPSASLRRDRPPRQVPGRAVIVPEIAPRLPSQHWGQCRHHQVVCPPSPVGKSLDARNARPQNSAKKYVPAVNTSASAARTSAKEASLSFHGCEVGFEKHRDGKTARWAFG